MMESGEITSVPQASTSTHSSHLRNRVLLAQGSGASGPSIMRITDANVTSLGGRASW